MSPPPPQGGALKHMNEEWLDTVMGLMADIIVTVYSNDKTNKKDGKEDRDR